MTVKLCKDCKYSFPEPKSEWNLRCSHIKVIKADPWELSTNKDNVGSSCFEERQWVWPFGHCGKRGALYERKGN